MNGVRTASEKQKLMKDIAFWARARGRQAPTSKEGWKVLIAEYFSQRVAQEVVPYETEIPDDEATHLIDDGATIQIADPVPQGVFEDDWNQLLRQRAEAAIGPNGEALDDFDQEFQLLGTAKAALDAEATFVRANPPTVLAGTLGNSVLCAPGENLKQVCNWIGDDAESTAVAITFTVGWDPVFSANAGAKFPYARIEYGCRGLTVPVDVDIGMGGQIVVGGSQVRVSVGLDTGSAGDAIVIGAMMSFQTTNKVLPATRTQSVTVPVADATTNTIPKFAKDVIFYRESGSDFTIVILNTGLSALFSQDFTGAQTMTVPIRIPVDAAFVQIASTAGVTIGRLVYGLAL